jgi:hypothetical protein
MQGKRPSYEFVGALNELCTSQPLGAFSARFRCGTLMFIKVHRRLWHLFIRVGVDTEMGLILYLTACFAEEIILVYIRLSYLYLISLFDSYKSVPISHTPSVQLAYVCLKRRTRPVKMF